MNSRIITHKRLRATESSRSGIPSSRAQHAAPTRVEPGAPVTVERTIQAWAFAPRSAPSAHLVGRHAGTIPHGGGPLGFQVRSGQQTRRPLRRRRERPDATQDTAAHIERQRLLVVEDDDGIAEPLVDGLSLEGFEIVRVRTGTEALTAGQVDLILLDLHLGHAYNPFDILNEKPPAFDVRQARP
jgi:hypothetical protein